MKYRSTRGGVSGLSFKQAVMMGLATDGGLLVPESLPDVRDEMLAWQSLSYPELAHRVMSLFIDDIASDQLALLIEKSYATFDSEKVTPLVTVGNLHILELFHGPTLAFKDIALQFLGNLFDHILEETNEHVNILGATSGDTGSAAIAGLRGRKNIDIYIMFPDGKTSIIQERQMTTVLDDNVHCLAIDGSFDDCQSILKALFNDAEFKQNYHLGAVNSVNWARILAQVVYYFSAWIQLGCPSAFQVGVPTGNFGNVFSSVVARHMGLPIQQSILATNENDILTRFFNHGVYRRGGVYHSHSPAMDIQVASNLERYLFYWFNGDTNKVSRFMSDFSTRGEATINFNTSQLDKTIAAGSATDEQTLATIARVHKETGYLLDPHTAVGVCVSSSLADADVPLVNLATAHPAKFSDVIVKSMPDMEVSHPILTRLDSLPVKKSELPSEVSAVKTFIAEQSRH